MDDYMLIARHIVSKLPSSPKRDTTVFNIHAISNLNVNLLDLSAYLMTHISNQHQKKYTLYVIRPSSPA